MCSHNLHTVSENQEEGVGSSRIDLMFKSFQFKVAVALDAIKSNELFPSKDSVLHENNRAA